MWVERRNRLASEAGKPSLMVSVCGGMLIAFRLFFPSLVGKPAIWILWVFVVGNLIDRGLIGELASMRGFVGWQGRT